ncbi:MAG: hypothetical protein A3H96_24250 [Acidobacteria bacterium RIFCSPLOWO2_02_FULL_67_36]|nr:MAG: hypothetical protein A3H96_24250 [Acidobacteria bacterium RIFCSPLOWO2_02_FULL_67_36]OFW18965.1 MAG: hypothetical protein A3G21_04500 [Acidobacteria bacterium RIFCSPLOWO2_12_FULL_66_21]
MLKRFFAQTRDFAVVIRHLRLEIGSVGLWPFAGVFAVSMFVMLFEGVGVGLLVPMLSLLLGGENATPMRPIQWLQSHFPGQSPSVYLSLVCIAIVCAIAAKNAASYTSQILASRLKRRVATNMRDVLFERLHRADLDVFDRAPGGEIANIFLVETYRSTVAIESFIGYVQRSSIALFYLFALFYISLRLTLLVVVLAVVLGFTLSFVYGRLSRAGIAVADLNHRLATTLTQSFAGVRVVRAANAQRREIDEFKRLNGLQADAEYASARASSLLFPLTETLAVIGAMTIVGCAYAFLVRPGHMLSSYLLAYGFLLLRLLPLMNQLYSMQGHLLYLAGGIREVHHWLQTPIYPVRPFGDVPFTGLQHELKFEGVSYTYPNGTVALREVTFAVGVGETVAIVGPSGSGKSTLAAILLRFRTPASGRVTADGRDCWEFSPETWHRATAVVEQDAFLFHGTLRENVVYGCQGITDEELARAITVANLDEVVRALPQGLDTLVGERGAMVSGGQRQRIAIARAILRDPGILILDEATSHLDAVSEQLVQQALQNAARGRTTIVIAHRLSTVREADRLIVMEHGEVVEQGTWESLEANRGLFHRLVIGV